MHGDDPDPKPVTPDEPAPVPDEAPPPSSQPGGEIDRFVLDRDGLG